MPAPANLIVTGYPGHDEYHLGTLFDGAPQQHLGAYQIGALEVPVHFWNSNVIVRKTPITVTRPPKDIVAANRMFPFGLPWKDCKIDAPINYTFKGPMDSAGTTIYMPTTGERPEIGLISDPSAHYMLSGAAGPMLAWAQASSSYPKHFRDEQTGKPIDLIKYPRANTYSQDKQGSPWLPPGPPDLRAPAFRAFADGTFVPQQAHYYELSYLAYCATQDPQFLVDLQYSANFTVHCDGYLSGARGIATVFGEYRGVAWAFRNLFMAHVATKDAEAAGTLPASCHPSSYWKALLDNQLAYYTATFKNDPKNQTFRLVTGGNRFGPWQADYMLLALAFGVLSGHSDWIPLYLWALKNAIDRTSGESGYPPGFGGAYYLNTVPYKTDANGKPIKDDFDISKPQFDWKAAFLYQQIDPDTSLSDAQIAALNTDPLNGGKPMTGNGYLMRTRAVLIAAAYLERKGLANVRGTYPMLDICIKNVETMLQKANTVEPRTAMVLDADAIPYEPPVSAPSQPAPAPSTPGEPAPLPVVVTPVPAPPAGFKPARPTSDDLRDDSPETYLKITDNKSRNIIGDGGTVVLWQWTGGGPNPGWFKEPVMTADGGFTWEESHASGQRLTLYGCAGLSIDGMLVKMPPPFPFPQAETPKPVPQPVPDPKPDPVPVPAPKPLARVAVSAIDTKVVTRAQKGERIIVTVSKKDMCELGPLK